MENQTMNKRVYGVIGIKSVMANWNADFSGYPRTTSENETFGSDKALKYPIKKMWQNEGEKVLYIKTYNKKFQPMSLTEKYNLLFSESPLQKKEKDKKTKNDKENIEYKNNLIKNLFSCIDVKNFGCTFAPQVDGNNISITGALQIAQGFNKYEDSTPQVMDITSPFPTKEGDSQTSIGKKIVSNEAHYAYYFVINPDAYADFVEMGVTDGYSEEDYQRFKEAALTSATSFNTNSKVGCENELAVFVETDKNTYLPDLSQYVFFEKSDNEDENDTIKLNFGGILNDVKDKIQSIEIYYNPYTTKVVADISNAKMMNIFTQDEVK